VLSQNIQDELNCDSGSYKVHINKRIFLFIPDRYLDSTQLSFICEAISDEHPVLTDNNNEDAKVSFISDIHPSMRIFRLMLTSITISLQD